MSFGIVATVGGTLIGGMMAADASEDAARTQAAAGDRATEAQERQYERQLALQEPWRQAGMSGLNALLQYTGLVTPEQVRAGLTPGGTPAGNPAAPMQQPQATYPGAGPQILGGGGVTDVQTYRDEHGRPWYVTPGGTHVMGAPPQQQAGAPGLPVRAELPPAAQTPAVPAAMIGSAQFGSLLRPFSAADFQADPGMAFRQEQGEQGLRRAALASGGTGSGKYLKDAMRFNSGLASQEYGAAENRYRAAQGDVFNRLAAIAGIGQAATNASTAAAGQFGSQIAGNIIGQGNALAAGQVGSANAWNQAIGQGASLYQQNALLRGMQGGGWGGGAMPPNPYYGTPTVPMAPATIGAPAYVPTDWYANA